MELREQVPHVAFHRLLGEEEANTDLAVHKTVADQLQHLDLPRRRLLLELGHRRLERDHLGDGVTASRNRFEAARVLVISGQDGITLCGVHCQAIDRLDSHL